VVFFMLELIGYVIIRMAWPIVWRRLLLLDLPLLLLLIFCCFFADAKTNNSVDEIITSVVVARYELVRIQNNAMGKIDK